jgi:MOSC domain-containing protein YiiM
MRLLSINAGTSHTQSKGTGVEITGIYKQPITGSARLTTLGIAGDFIGDSKHHGGPDQAIYVYAAEDYAWWSQQLGQPLAPGTFGENLTTSGIEVTTLNIGDRMGVGGVVVEVTAARIPCSTLARRMADITFTKAFRDAERPGAYCRVIQPGDLRAGDAIALAHHTTCDVTVLEMFREHYQRPKDQRALQRILGAPISARARNELENELTQLRSQEDA